MLANTVFVIGMHRSGTSALAGALANLGLSFFEPNDEVKGSVANPKGFFERSSLIQLNDSLLATHDWSWDSLDLNFFEVEKATEFITQAQSYISNLKDDAPLGVKDPRSCVLMPFWRRALLDRLELMVITRDPAEVAWSLQVRDGLPVEVGLALYIAYSTHLAQGIQGLLPHFVRYENLVNSPTTELTLIAQFLHNSDVPVLHQQSDIDVAAKSIDSNLRRETFPRWVDEHPLTIEARSIRELLHQASSTDISITPSHLCHEILEYQFTVKKLLDVNNQLHQAREEVKLTKFQFEQKCLQLIQTETSFSLRLGLFLTWPIRKLRPSNQR